MIYHDLFLDEVFNLYKTLLIMWTRPISSSLLLFIVVLLKTPNEVLMFVTSGHRSRLSPLDLGPL